MNGAATGATVPPGRPHGIGQALLLFGISFFLVISIGSVAQGVSLNGGLAVTLVLLILVPALIFVRLKEVSIFEGLRLWPVQPAVVLSSFVLGCGTWSLGMLIARGLSELGLRSFGQGVEVGLDSATDFAVRLLVVAVGAGVCEEALFRGAIQGVLERRSKWFAVIVTAILFGLFHQALAVAIPATVLGCFYGWLVIRTGSIVPAMVAHFANNAVAISYVYFLDGANPPWLLPLGVLLGVAAVAAIIGLTSTNQHRVTESPMSQVPAALPLWSTIGCLTPLLMLTVSVVGLVSALPYFIQVTTLDDGEVVVYADPDSPVFNSLIEKQGAQVLYAQGEESLMGEVVTRDETTLVIRDQSGAEVAISTADLQGVVVSH